MESRKVKKEQTKPQVDPETAQRLQKIQEAFKLSYKGINSVSTGRPGKSPLSNYEIKALPTS